MLAGPSRFYGIKLSNRSDGRRAVTSLCLGISSGRVMLDFPNEVNHSDDNEADLTNVRNGNHHDLTPLIKIGRQKRSFAPRYDEGPAA